MSDEKERFCLANNLSFLHFYLLSFICNFLLSTFSILLFTFYLLNFFPLVNGAAVMDGLLSPFCEIFSRVNA